MPVQARKEFVKGVTYASICVGIIVGAVAIYILCVDSSELAGAILLSSFIFVIISSCSWSSFNKGVHSCYALWIFFLFAAAVLALAGGIVLMENQSIGQSKKKDEEKRLSDAAVIIGGLSSFTLPLLFVSFLCEYGYRKQMEESDERLLSKA